MIEPSKISVVVGIIRNQQGQLLIAQRPAHKHASGLWEFPGGKIEKDEDHFVALQREFKEEVGIDILSATPWFQITHDYSDRIVFLNTWRIDRYAGEPCGAEGQLIQWIDVHQLNHFEFPAGNKEIISRLLLGSVDS